jgi:hypothetical protein
MGRTLPTQIQILHVAAEEWKDFRRALRQEDRDAFDALWSYARRHAAASSMASRPLPFDAHCFSMLVELEKSVQKLKEHLKIFEEKMTNQEI